MHAMQSSSGYGYMSIVAFSFLRKLPSQNVLLSKRYRQAGASVMTWYRQDIPNKPTHCQKTIKGDGIDVCIRVIPWFPGAKRAGCRPTVLPSRSQQHPAVKTSRGSILSGINNKYKRSTPGRCKRIVENLCQCFMSSLYERA